ncbi:MAG: DUF167 domain-containing protein [Alphaproteobacteria bacterium]|nr:DUF167 domain-containing protein [Alphaproteobacteria bacterium]
MRDNAGPLSRRDSGIVLAILLQPHASDSRLVGVEVAADGTRRLKARVTAAPTDGQANRALVKLIAKVLDIAPSRVTIERGETDRRKLIAIEGDSDALVQKLNPWLEGRE